MTEEQMFTRDICKGAFLKALGDRGLGGIHLKFLEEGSYKKKMGWLKTRWKECYRPNRNITEKLIE